MIDNTNFVDQLATSMERRYKNLRKVRTGSGDYYKTRCFLDYPYFRDDHKIIATIQANNRQ